METQAVALAARAGGDRAGLPGVINRQIAARLGVSEETVKTHVRNALVKFNLHGKGELRMALGECGSGPPPAVVHLIGCVY